MTRVPKKPSLFDSMPAMPPGPWFSPSRDPFHTSEDPPHTSIRRLDGDLKQRLQMLGIAQPPVADVAKCILKTHGGIMDSIKLQKLTYFAQVWSRVWYEQDAFQAPILAFKHGPCIKQLESDYGGVGAKRIQAGLFSRGDDAGLTSTLRCTIEAVVEAYGPLTSTELEELTHAPGTPWSQVYRDGQGAGGQIRADLYEPYYRHLYERRSA